MLLLRYCYFVVGSKLLLSLLRCRKRTTNDVVASLSLLRCRKRTTNDVDASLSEIGTEQCLYFVIGSKSNYGRTMLLLLLSEANRTTVERCCYWRCWKRTMIERCCCCPCRERTMIDVETGGLREQACVL